MERDTRPDDGESRIADGRAQGVELPGCGGGSRGRGPCEGGPQIPGRLHSGRTHALGDGALRRPLRRTPGARIARPGLERRRCRNEAEGGLPHRPTRHGGSLPGQSLRERHSGTGSPSPLLHGLPGVRGDGRRGGVGGGEGRRLGVPGERVRSPWGGDRPNARLLHPWRVRSGWIRRRRRGAGPGPGRLVHHHLRCPGRAPVLRPAHERIHSGAEDRLRGDGIGRR